MLSGEPSHHGAPEGAYMVCPENPDVGGGRWYLSKKEIDENSPSRRDGIDLKKETQLRKSYCTYLQDLGMRLKVPQVTIATAIIFCHRFFLRQSHAKSDRMTVATVCMFLAGKVEETPRPLKDLILVSYDIIHKKNEAVARRIKQKDIYERQKELILLGERVVLTTLAFDLNVLHPYKPLVDAIKKFKVAKKPLAQVAWNFVNDGLRTSLCLQFKPRHIAAGAIFLAAKFLKVKLPVDSWWTEFDIQPRQLEEVSNQMLELYEQNRMLPSQTSEAEGGAGGSQRPQSRGPPDDENLASRSSFHDGPTTSKVVSTSLKKAPSRPVPEGPQAADNHGGPPIITRTQNTDNGSPETSSIPDQKGDGEFNDTQNHERESTPSHDRNLGETQNKSRFGADGNNKDDQGHSRGTELRDTVESKDEYHGRDLSNNDVTVSQSPGDATKLDEKLKAAMERKKACRTLTPKSEPVDDLETALEDVVVPNEKEKIKCEGKQSCTKSSHNPDYPNEAEALSHVKREQSSVEEGEFKPFDDSDKKYESPGPSSRKRKSDSPLDKPHEGNQRTDYAPGSQKQNHHEYPDDRNGVAKA